MRRRVVVALAAAGALAAGGVVAGGDVFINAAGAGCGPGSRELLDAFESLPILDAHPAGAEETESDSGCEADAGYAVVWRTYRASQPAPQVEAFYQQAARAGGWSPAQDASGSSPGLCFTTTVDGAHAYLAVSFRGAAGAGEGYTLEVTGSHQSDTGC